MSSILDIARSGVLAYRTALAVTAENVANVGTEGYRRRDVATQAVCGTQATATTLPSGGQGVTVVSVRRAFDALVADRARSASGAQSAAETHLRGAEAIEGLMLPGDDGIDGVMRGFFDALTNLSAKPADTTTRLLALRAGEGLAGAMSGLAAGLDTLRADLASEAQAMIQSAQGLMEELAEVSRRMGGLSIPGTGSAESTHALADRRDRVLDDMARLLPIDVDLAEDGRPVVRLSSPAGPVLVAGNDAGTLTLGGADPLTLRVLPPGADTAQDQRMLARGALAGISRAIGALDMAAQELDGLARTLAGTMNAVHRGGVDQTGAAGGDLFTLDGWLAQPAPANRGAVQVTVQAVASDAARGPVALVHDGAAGLWRALDADGREIGAGSGRLVLPGAVVDLSGRALDGDRIMLTPVSGHARDLRLAVTDPAALAAATAYATVAAPGNAGSASLTVAPLAEPPSGLSPVAALLGDGPVDLLGGVLGLLPAGTAQAGLVSLGRPARVDLMPPAGASLLTVTLDGTAHAFDLPPLTDAAALAAGLGDGTLRSRDGQVLGALGLTVSLGTDGSLSIMRPGGGAPPAAVLDGPAGPVPGLAMAAEAPGGTVQLITRNGRHVAGTPLTAAEAARLLTPANGFLPGAVYDPSPLASGAQGAYRNAGLDGFSVPGLQGLRLGGTAGTGAVLPLPAAAPRNLELSDASGRTASIALPAGASAALAASRLDAALPGLSAQASTGLALSALPDGVVRFSLQGANVAPVAIEATLAGDVGPLVLALNAAAGTTGIRAERSPDGQRILLVQPDGHDITLSALDLPAGATLQATASGPDGQPLAAPVVLGGAVSVLRQGGTVALHAAQGFGLAEGGSLLGSAPDAATGGAVRLTAAQAGAEVRAAFAEVPEAAEGGLLYRVTLAGRTVETALPPGAAAADVAAALAASLRQDAPGAVLRGAPMSGPPAEGATLALTVDGAVHQLRFEGGRPVISGPEPGRLQAEIDAENRLVIRAAGVADGAGIGVATAPGLGFATGQASLTLTGAAPAAAGSVLTVRTGGVDHALTVSGGAVAVPPGFAGSATIDPASGALRLTLPVPGDALRVQPSAAAGFGGPGAAIRAEGDALIVTGDGPPLDLRIESRGAIGRSLDLTRLPPEDLVVAMTGSGTLRLAGSVSEGAPPSGPGAVEIVAGEAATGLVLLRDAVSGHAIASGRPDAAGRVVLGGLSVQITGALAAGDRFAMAPVGAGSANGGTALALAALRNADPVNGGPGLIERMTRLQSETGLRTAAASRSLATATAAAESADRAQAAIGAVDLDAEAARLVELQQGYQASSQALAIARSLFDTLMQII